ncbi:RNA polymerase sigma factor [Ornithinimicrobium cryptoxanthini]|uniref:RNA polymerase sigma factor n=1 Tax=Ornithinimicrobium cryptoxanthini TaxID=2934161 RepID=UPI0021196729|nr:RNA polymerase sigma factor [Ornithinimicrobium cryptoxanthini]
MSEHLKELVRALHASDGTAARSLLREIPATDDDSLQELAVAAANGSELGTTLLVERLDESGILHRFARGALFDEGAIDDVVQDSLISVATGISSFRGTAKVTSWVHRIVRNRVVDHLRRQRATAPLPEEDLGPGQRISSLIATRATVQDALAALPDLYRESVTMRDLEGRPYAEIAERLDRSLGTVKSQVSRGRALVAVSLRDLRPGQAGAAGTSPRDTRNSPSTLNSASTPGDSSVPTADPSGAAS